MKTYIADASVILKWVLPMDDEPNSDLALQLRDDAIARRVLLKVPSLWLYEVGNTVCRLLPKQSQKILSMLSDLNLTESPPTAAWLKKACELTEKYTVTFYDAAYHALAFVEKGTLITADDKYLNKTIEAGHILALSKYS